MKNIVLQGEHTDLILRQSGKATHREDAQTALSSLTSLCQPLEREERGSPPSELGAGGGGPVVCDFSRLAILLSRR